MRSYKRSYAVEGMVCMGLALCLLLALSEGCTGVKKTTKAGKKITVTFSGEENSQRYMAGGELP